MHHRKNRTSCCLVSILTVIVLFIVVALVAFNPMSHLFWGSQNKMDLALIFDETNPVHIKFYQAAIQSIDDINQSVESLYPKPPRIETFNMTKNFMNTNGSTQIEEIEEFRKIFGSKIFLDLRPNSDLTHSQFSSGDCPGCSLVTIDPSMKETEETVFKYNLHQLAKAYLKAFDELNPTNKSMEVIPIFRKQNSGSRIFHETLVMESKPFKDLKLTRPVIYEASKYPRSDAFQVVAEIGSRIVISSGAILFFISNEDLAYILEVAQRVNPELGKRRWYVRDLWAVDEDDLRRTKEMERFCAQVSLTSITYLSSGNPKLHKVALERLSSHDRKNYGSIFAEAGIYSKMMDLHKEFTDKLVGKNFKKSMIKRPEPEIILAVEMFSPLDGNPAVILPFNGWIVQALIKSGLNGSDIHFERIYTHPLEKQEIDRALSTEKCDAASTSIEVYLHETLLTPKSKFLFKLEEFPKTLVIPATGGIALALHCQDNAETLDLVYTCVPKKYTVGQLTCAIIKQEEDSSVERSLARVERAVGTSSNPDPEFWGEIWKEMGELWKSWKELVPDIFSCTASVAGCDMCFYFLGTYNYSVVPAACVGGCTINTFDSCSGVVSKALIGTIKDGMKKIKQRGNN